MCFMPTKKVATRADSPAVDAPIVAVTPGDGWQVRLGDGQWQQVLQWAYDAEGSAWPVMATNEGPSVTHHCGPTECRRPDPAAGTDVTPRSAQ